MHKLIINQDDEISPYEQLYNYKMKLKNYMRTFGEMGVVKITYSEITSKLKNKGYMMMFIGYILSHGSNVYRILNLQTHRVSVTRDVSWINKMYVDWDNKDKGINSWIL